MLIIYNQLRKDSFFFNAKMHSAKVHSVKVQAITTRNNVHMARET
jgi:hypothetical protein